MPAIPISSRLIPTSQEPYPIRQPKTPKTRPQCIPSSLGLGALPKPKFSSSQSISSYPTPDEDITPLNFYSPSIAMKEASFAAQGGSNLDDLINAKDIVFEDSKNIAISLSAEEKENSFDSELSANLPRSAVPHDMPPDKFLAYKAVLPSSFSLTSMDMNEKDYYPYFNPPENMANKGALSDQQEISPPLPNPFSNQTMNTASHSVLPDNIELPLPFTNLKLCDFFAYFDKPETESFSVKEKSDGLYFKLSESDSPGGICYQPLNEEDLYKNKMQEKTSS